MYDDTRKKILRKQKRERRGVFFQCATGGNVSSLRNVVSVPWKVSRDTLQSERLLYIKVYYVAEENGVLSSRIRKARRSSFSYFSNARTRTRTQSTRSHASADANTCPEIFANERWKFQVDLLLIRGLRF